MQEYQVGLEEVRFFANHGLFPEERILGNWFLLTVRVSKQVHGIQFEQIEETFDYGKIYTICQEVMAEPVDLLETVAQRIANKLKQSFCDIMSYEIHVWKEQPPLGMLGGKSCVSLKEKISI
ncbi:dihydroneopterin aldolase [Aquirufa regiilacus]|uniref:7,8-dihydroneopterin aldolase n=1 Tax=Aquirufa regiilacus TaxID=3024868 RepID=A0ABU3TQ33_9BACT|nr:MULTISPECIES: dihydroneopterin aldolase [unclassified Aquirufa]MDT8887346.1 dihydroneopterin aldolase [Aquirufa sp. LEPPI-3A]MDU0807980.1 dihydroneopterin aldolase [Aquirufa sp. LEOWEIH-7C]